LLQPFASEDAVVVVVVEQYDLWVEPAFELVCRGHVLVASSFEEECRDRDRSERVEAAGPAASASPHDEVVAVGSEIPVQG
jgi:hypothetical protein